jgi:atypical dual specificity phosphatase
MRILYVENHAVFAANVINQFLAQHAVTVASSLTEARRALEVGSFDLLLVDYDLDDGKGDALLNELRASGKAIPAIAVSSHEEGNLALLRAGAVAVCSKMQFDRIQSLIDTVTAHGKPGASSLVWWVIPGALAGMPMPFIHPERRLNMGGPLSVYADELAALYAAGVRAVVCLLNIPSDAPVYESAGFAFKCLPVPDGRAPTLEQAHDFIAFVDRQLADHHPVAVHCEAGLGRTGTMIATYLISHGESAASAISRVRAAEKSAVETPRQIQFLEQFAAQRKLEARVPNDSGDMVTVYSLRRDKRHVEDVQRATLTTKDFGIEPTHGLFGSEEWWNQIASGKLPVERLCGVITRLYMGSMNDWPEFSMRSDAGQDVSWSRYANSEHLADFYAVGRRVEVDYIVQHHRAASFDGGAETKCVIEVRIGAEAAALPQDGATSTDSS